MDNIQSVWHRGSRADRVLLYSQAAALGIRRADQRWCFCFGWHGRDTDKHSTLRAWWHITHYTINDNIIRSHHIYRVTYSHALFLTISVSELKTSSKGGWIQTSVTINQLALFSWRVILFSRGTAWSWVNDQARQASKARVACVGLCLFSSML